MDASVAILFFASMLALAAKPVGATPWLRRRKPVMAGPRARRARQRVQNLTLGDLVRLGCGCEPAQFDADAGAPALWILTCARGSVVLPATGDPTFQAHGFVRLRDGVRPSRPHRA